VRSSVLLTKPLIAGPETQQNGGPEAQAKPEALLERTQELFFMHELEKVRKVVVRAYGQPAWVWFLLPICLLAMCAIVYFCLGVQFSVAGAALSLILVVCLFFSVRVLVVWYASNVREAKALSKFLPKRDSMFRDVLAKRVMERLELVADQIRVNQQLGDFGGMEFANELREDHFKPLFNAAKELGLLPPEVVQEGYGFFFKKAQ